MRTRSSHSSANEQAADEVNAILRAGNAAVMSVNLAETLDVLSRVHELSTDELEAIITPLLDEVVNVVAPGEAEASEAAALRSRHYSRRDLPLSLADCLLPATAALRGDTIATTDPGVLTVARAEGIELRPLGSAGETL